VPEKTFILRTLDGFMELTVQSDNYTSMACPFVTALSVPLTQEIMIQHPELLRILSAYLKSEPKLISVGGVKRKTPR